MKRIASGTIAMGLALAMVGGLVQTGLAAPPTASPTLTGPEGQTAVKSGDPVTFGGSVESGATLVSAHLRFLSPDGDAVRSPMNVTPVTTIQNGQLHGSTNVPYLDPTSADGGTILLAVVVERAGEESDPALSNPLKLDLVKPRIEYTALTALDEIKVQFSEPVRIPDILGDAVVTDWTVKLGDNQYPVIGISGAGAARVLTLASSLDEDDTPIVQYKQSVPRKTYEDGAGNILSAANRFSTARDHVAPLQVPEILKVAGQDPSGAVGNDPQPTVRIGNLRSGHVGEVYLESDGAPGRTPGDVLLGDAQADGSGEVTIQVADLGEDGDLTLYGVARDRALCDPDGGSERCPNRTNAASAATYTLDRVAPGALYAAHVAARTIDVGFTEDLFPAGGDPAEWAVVSQGAIPIAVGSVSGSGDVRTLHLSADLPSGPATVSFSPASGYQDVATNVLAAFEGLAVVDGVPPTVTILSPTAPSFQKARPATITGRSSEDGTLIELYTDADNDNVPDLPTPLATHQLAAGQDQFSIGVDLTPNTSNSFVVRALDSNAGPFADVPTITHDDVRPQVSINRPNDSDYLRGGITFNVEWSAIDDHFGPGPIRVELSLDGGATWSTLAGALPNTGTYAWQVPSANSEQAKIRVTATDKAGNASSAQSQQFVIDSTPPEFDATTLDARHVRISFSEPVSGELVREHWKIGPMHPDFMPNQPFQNVEMTVDGRVVGFTLQTIEGHTIGANDTPKIKYGPLPFAERFKDRSGNVVRPDQHPETGDFTETTTVKARDGIAPLVPAVNPVPGVVAADAQPVTGVAEEDSTNQAVARRIQPSSDTFSADVQPDGSYDVLAGLVRNARNVFLVQIQDPAGNVSGWEKVVIDEDSIRPRAKYRKPKRPRSGRNVAIRWTSREAHPDRATLKYQLRKGRGKVTRLIVANTEDDGRYRYWIPSRLRGKDIRFRIILIDEAGNRRGTFSPWMTVR